jgi:ligand-binding sensor domain-containing protein
MKNRPVLCWFVAAFVVTCAGGEAVSQTDFWQKTNDPNGGVGYALAINASGTIFVGTNRGVSRSTDNGANWTESNSDSTLDVGVFAFKSTGTIFAVGYPGVYRSTDDGLNWTLIANGGGLVKSLAINDSGHIFIGSWNEQGTGSVFRSTDNGASWINTGLGSNTYALAINASGYIFAGGYRNGGGCVLRSTDNGASWTDTGLPSGDPVDRLVISPAGHIFAGTASGVFRSTDNQAQWDPNAGLRTSQVTALAVNASGHVFAGAVGAGVYRSTDDGASWTPINKGLTNDSVVSIAISPAGDIFAETDGGLFQSVQSTTSVRGLSPDAPMSFSLGQNYPNPFNPSTKIGFMIHVSGFTTLKVYDVLGREVRTLVNENLQPGSYETTFDATGLASGVYFYRLHAGQFVEMKKLVVLR